MWPVASKHLLTSVQNVHPAMPMQPGRPTQLTAPTQPGQPAQTTQATQLTRPTQAAQRRRAPGAAKPEIASAHEEIEDLIDFESSAGTPVSLLFSCFLAIEQLLTFIKDVSTVTRQAARLTLATPSLKLKAPQQRRREPRIQTPPLQPVAPPARVTPPARTASPAPGTPPMRVSPPVAATPPVASTLPVAATPSVPRSSSTSPAPALSPLTLQQAQQTALQLELRQETRTVTFLSLLDTSTVTRLFEQTTTKIRFSNPAKKPVQAVAAQFGKDVGNDLMVLRIDAGDELGFACMLEIIAGAKHWENGTGLKLIVPVEVFLAEE